MSTSDELDPVRLEDAARLQLITDRFDADPDGLLDRAIMHPHAVLDTAQRRVDEAGLTQQDPKITAAIMTTWVDGFLAGQRAMAETLGIDLDDDGMDT